MNVIDFWGWVKAFEDYLKENPSRGNDNQSDFIKELRKRWNNNELTPEQKKIIWKIRKESDQRRKYIERRNVKLSDLIRYANPESQKKPKRKD